MMNRNRISIRRVSTDAQLPSLTLFYQQALPPTLLMPEPHFPGTIGQYNGRWWPGFSHRHAISIHDIYWEIPRVNIKISNSKYVDNSIFYTLANDVLQEHNADNIVLYVRRLTGPDVHTSSKKTHTRNPSYLKKCCIHIISNECWQSRHIRWKRYRWNFIAHSNTFLVCLVIPEIWKSSFQPSNYGPVF